MLKPSSPSPALHNDGNNRTLTPNIQTLRKLQSQSLGEGEEGKKKTSLSSAGVRARFQEEKSPLYDRSHRSSLVVSPAAALCTPAHRAALFHTVHLYARGAAAAGIHRKAFSALNTSSLSQRKKRLVPRWPLGAVSIEAGGWRGRAAGTWLSSAPALCLASAQEISWRNQAAHGDHSNSGCSLLPPEPTPAWTRTSPLAMGNTGTGWNPPAHEPLVSSWTQPSGAKATWFQVI